MIDVQTAKFIIDRLTREIDEQNDAIDGKIDDHGRDKVPLAVGRVAGLDKARSIVYQLIRDNCHE